MRRVTIKWSIIILLIINVLLAIYSTPVLDLGDSTNYIAFSHKLLGATIAENTAHRSPLMSIIVAVFIFIFGNSAGLKIAVLFNYALVFLTSLITFLIFKKLFKKEIFPFLIALTFNLSFSTIYHANIILTEILSVFLLMLSVYLLIRLFDSEGKINILLLGSCFGLLTLARFNSIPLFFSFIFLLLYLFIIEHKEKFKTVIINLLLFILPYFMVCNFWALYNLNHNGFYGLFPTSGTLIGRNTIVASIDSNTVVSVTNKQILQIFLKARKDYFDNNVNTELKGSFVNSVNQNILTDLYSGYNIYCKAIPDMITYFNLSQPVGEYEINKNLSGFYKEVENQNKAFIRKVRFYSLLSSFRSSSGGVLPESYGKINLNILPGWVFKVYKILIPCISLFVFISFIYLTLISIIKRRKPPYELLVLFIILFSFFGINFIFSTASDANRYKFPSEPILFGLFFLYLFYLVNWSKIKILKNRRLEY